MNPHMPGPHPGSHHYTTSGGGGGMPMMPSHVLPTHQHQSGYMPAVMMPPNQPLGGWMDQTAPPPHMYHPTPPMYTQQVVAPMVPHHHPQPQQQQQQYMGHSMHSPQKSYPLPQHQQPVVPPPAAPGGGDGAGRFRGTLYLRAKNKWRARIGHEGKKHEIGVYDTEEEAARMYDLAAIRLQGSKATTNYTYSFQTNDKGEIVTIKDTTGATFNVPSMMDLIKPKRNDVMMVTNTNPMAMHHQPQQQQQQPPQPHQQPPQQPPPPRQVVMPANPTPVAAVPAGPQHVHGPGAMGMATSNPPPQGGVNVSHPTVSHQQVPHHPLVAPPPSQPQPVTFHHPPTMSAAATPTPVNNGNMDVGIRKTERRIIPVNKEYTDQPRYAQAPPPRPRQSQLTGLEAMPRIGVASSSTVAKQQAQPQQQGAVLSRDQQTLHWATNFLEHHPTDIPFVFELSFHARYVEKLNFEAVPLLVSSYTPPAKRLSYLRLKGVPRALTSVLKDGDIVAAANGELLVGTASSLGDQLVKAHDKLATGVAMWLTLRMVRKPTEVCSQEMDVWAKMSRPVATYSLGLDGLVRLEWVDEALPPRLQLNLAQGCEKGDAMREREEAERVKQEEARRQSELAEQKRREELQQEQARRFAVQQAMLSQQREAQQKEALQQQQRQQQQQAALQLQQQQQQLQQQQQQRQQQQQEAQRRMAMAAAAVTQSNYTSQQAPPPTLQLHPTPYQQQQPPPSAPTPAPPPAPGPVATTSTSTSTPPPVSVHTPYRPMVIAAPPLRTTHPPQTTTTAPPPNTASSGAPSMPPQPPPQGDVSSSVPAHS